MRSSAAYGRRLTRLAAEARIYGPQEISRSGTPNPWRMAAYAIRTPVGVAFLLIDGPPVVWTDREADAALIPKLMELGAGT